jgi:hypothetical protein
MNVARTLKDAYNLSNPVQPLPHGARATWIAPPCAAKRT